MNMKTREKQLTQQILELRSENARLQLGQPLKQIITTIIEEESNEESE